MFLNCPVRQRLWSHGNMALYKFCIVLYEHDSLCNRGAPVGSSVPAALATSVASSSLNFSAGVHDGVTTSRDHITPQLCRLSTDTPISRVQTSRWEPPDDVHWARAGIEDSGACSCTVRYGVHNLEVQWFTVFGLQGAGTLNPMSKTHGNLPVENH